MLNNQERIDPDTLIPIYANRFYQEIIDVKDIHIIFVIVTRFIHSFYNKFKDVFINSEDKMNKMIDYIF